MFLAKPLRTLLLSTATILAACNDSGGSTTSQPLVTCEMPAPLICRNPDGSLCHGPSGSAWALGFPGGSAAVNGPLYPLSATTSPLATTTPPPADDTLGRLRYWTGIALNANAIDHTPVPPGDPRVFGEQLGPTRTGRAFAIFHIALFDAVNAIAGGYQSYTGIAPAPPDASMGTAIAQAAHDTLVALWPSQTETFDTLLAADLAQFPNTCEKSAGIELGSSAAAAILALRADDGSEKPEPQLGVDYVTGDQPGQWRQDPVGQSPLAIGAFWGEVKPFAMQSAEQFRAPDPPALDSAEYTAAFNEAKALGGDNIVTPSTRTDDQTIAGIYWAYDKAPNIGAPPRLYTQITLQLAHQMKSNVVDQARLLALVNVAVADASIAVWESKYHYVFWRPVNAIREADVGTGPSGLGDGNPNTAGDPTFTPLGAPASNFVPSGTVTMGPNFTPPFPSYPSGHAGLGGSLFQILRRFYGTDDIAFTFVSDEYNGVNANNQGQVRPLTPRTFPSLTAADEENGQSRIYLGIHWSFDKTEGRAQGQRVADWVYDHSFRPVP